MGSLTIGGSRSESWKACKWGYSPPAAHHSVYIRKEAYPVLSLAPLELESLWHRQPETKTQRLNGMNQRYTRLFSLPQSALHTHTHSLSCSKKRMSFCTISLTTRICSHKLSGNTRKPFHENQNTCLDVRLSICTILRINFTMLPYAMKLNPLDYPEFASAPNSWEG